MLAMAGCSEQSQSELAPVTGTVLLDEQPLKGGTIITMTERGRGAHGSVDASGRFSLSTRGLGEGAVVGSHRVAVIVAESSNPASVNPEAEIKLTIPSRYTQAASSGLQIDVRPNQGNEVTLRLTSARP